MAAFSHSRVGSRSSLFHGGGGGGGYGEVEQPNGSCNYRDLSFGTKAPVCGCQRFYLNGGHLHRQGQDIGLDGAWCFCGHHACFHNAFSEQQKAQEQALTMSRAGGGNEELGYGDGIYQSAQQATSSPIAPAKTPAGLGITSGSRSESQSINTRVWQALNEFARNQEDGGVSDTTSKLPSTAAHSVVEEPRLSPNRMIHERLQQYRSMGPPVHIPQPAMPRLAEDYSATEVATPSIAGTPDFRALASSSNQVTTSPGHLQPSRLESGRHIVDHNSQPAEARPESPSRAGDERNAPPNQTSSLRDLEDMIRTYSQRLEVLESLSFSNVPIEEIQERFELFDGRILDLEQWRTDQENQQRASPEPKKASKSKRRRLLPDEKRSFDSDASFDSNAAAHAEAAVLATLAANAETHPRIDALERRVTDLENVAPPSFAQPWQVQVVLLPWGRELRGIWFSSTDATQHSLRSTTQASEEWTGAQSAPKLSFKSSVNGAWTTESIEAWAKEAQEWLSPKACGPTGTVFQRLASRGLVCDVTLTATDARHILNAVNEAFEKTLVGDDDLGAESMARYHGLRESFIPLRKVRKSSRLRFLSPAEMVTSATWTAAFLDSSVFMKVNDGQKRLYITTPGAYMQSDNGCTWNMIRELPARDMSGEQQPAQVENAAVEVCWTHNNNLDQPLSVHSSFASEASQGSVRSQNMDFNAEEGAQPPISPRSETRFPRQRTVSFPNLTSPSGFIKETIPKRRVASFEPVTTQPIDAYGYGTEITAKRRRISSKSPEAEAHGVNFTPRWSREPPSPYTSEPAVEARSQGTSSRNKRGTTPFAYATPHSNSNFIGRVEFLTGDGDTEADTEILGDNHSDRGEEEWEGVGEDDGNTNLAEGESDGESVGNEAEINDDDLDDDI